MSGPARAGALIYALDLSRVAAFYQRLLSMRLLHADEQHQVLASADFQLIIHAIPAEYAVNVVIDTPPLPRTEQAIKLFFTVDSLDIAEKLAVSLGGALHEPRWSGPGFCVRNGHDPEGNIFHLRESHPA